MLALNDGFQLFCYLLLDCLLDSVNYSYEWYKSKVGDSKTASAEEERWQTLLLLLLL